MKKNKNRGMIAETRLIRSARGRRLIMTRTVKYRSRHPNPLKCLLGRTRISVISTVKRANLMRGSIFFKLFDTPRIFLFILHSFLGL